MYGSASYGETAYAGQVASQDVDVQATTASLTLTTYAAAVFADEEIQATTHALALTTHSTTVSLDIDVQATTDALSLTTIAATVDGTDAAGTATIIAIGSSAYILGEI